MSASADAPDDRLVRSSLALLVSYAVSAVLGVVFWIVADHLYPAADVGRCSAEIAAMMFVASLVQFSPAVLFNRFLWRSGARALDIARRGYLTALVVAGLGATAFLLVSGPHPYLGTGLRPVVLFVLAVMLWVVFSVEDSALIGLRRTKVIPIENGAFSMLKVLLLFVLVHHVPASGIFDAWISPLVIIVVPINWWLFRRLLPEHVRQANGRSSVPDRRTLGRIVGGEYLGTLTMIALTSLPALFVLRELGAQDAAYFQTPWLVGTSIDFLLWTIATSIIAEVSARPNVAPQAIRKGVRYSTYLLVPVMVVSLLAGPYAIRILGPAYANHGTRLLEFLLCALPFVAINVLYVTYARLARRVRRVIFAQGSISLLVLILMISLLHTYRDAGAGVAFLVGQGVVALVVAPSVIRQYRRPSMSPGFALNSPVIVIKNTGNDE
jgi:O-antigen/teichoic acid export membrane protein